MKSTFAAQLCNSDESLGLAENFFHFHFFTRPKTGRDCSVSPTAKCFRNGGSYRSCCNNFCPCIYSDVCWFRQPKLSVPFPELKTKLTGMQNAATDLEGKTDRVQMDIGNARDDQTT